MAGGFRHVRTLSIYLSIYVSIYVSISHHITSHLSLSLSLSVHLHRRRDRSAVLCNHLGQAVFALLAPLRFALVRLDFRSELVHSLQTQKKGEGKCWSDRTIGH